MEQECRQPGSGVPEHRVVPVQARSRNLRSHDVLRIWSSALGMRHSKPGGLLVRLRARSIDSVHRPLTVRRRSPTRAACDGPFSPADAWRKTWSTLRTLAADPGCLASTPAGSSIEQNRRRILTAWQRKGASSAFVPPSETPDCSHSASRSGLTQRVVALEPYISIPLTERRGAGKLPTHRVG